MPMASEQPKAGRLVVLSGPSGSGKSTLVERTLAQGDLRVRRSISATTRSPRPGEVDGEHYHFWSEAQFDEAIKQGRFLEYANVYDHRYGTLHSEVDSYLKQGLCVLLEIDVQGATQIRQRCQDCVLVFLKASSAADYARRIRQRPNETGADLQRRIQAAQTELAHASAYDHVVINDDLDAAAHQFHDLLKNICGG
jgi:guanylate kinase